MKDERGIAMVLAISLIGLLSSLGLYLIMESGTAYRTTKSMVRSETAFNLADGGVQLGLHCISTSAPSPSYAELSNPVIQSIQKGLPSYMTAQSVGDSPGEKKPTVTPSIDYVGYKTTPPAGWMVNWQGNSSFYSLYYRSRGQAAVPISESQASALSRVGALVLKVTR